MIRVAAIVLSVLIVLASGLTGYVFWAPNAALASIQKLTRWHAGLVRKELNAGGLHFVYLEGGSGEPLVLLHGFGGEKDSFTRVAAHLTPSYRLIIPDQPGFGESEKSAAIPYTLDDQVERIHAFVRELGLGKIALGGNSMGGFVAAAYAARYPDEVSSLWLLAAAGLRSAPPSELATALKQQGKSLAPSSVEEFEELLSFVVTEPPKLPRRILRVMAERAVANRPLQNEIARQIQASAPLEDRLRNLATPSLIVWGDRDRVIHPAAADILQKLLPNSQVRIMAGVGHLPMIENTALAAQDYLNFRAALR